MLMVLLTIFLKIGLPIIIESLCVILNLSIANGVFADSWKIARVAPIFKSSPTKDQSNYRPISVLPFILRVFEKLIHNQLYDCLDRNTLLFSKQSGFRFLHSVVTCLLISTSQWQPVGSSIGRANWVWSNKPLRTTPHSPLFHCFPPDSKVVETC